MKKLLVLTLCLLVALSACSSEDTAGQPEQISPPSKTQELPESQPVQDAQMEQVLLDDDCVKVSYIEVFEVEGVEGVFYFRLEVENKTEKVVTIALIDPSVNNVSTLALSGVPMVIQPGGKSLTPFFFSYGNLDIATLDELQEISFKVRVDDNDSFKEIETSNFVTVSF